MIIAPLYIAMYDKATYVSSGYEIEGGGMTEKLMVLPEPQRFTIEDDQAVTHLSVLSYNHFRSRLLRQPLALSSDTSLSCQKLSRELSLVASSNFGSDWTIAWK